MEARSRTLGPLSPSFELVKYLRQALTKFLPDNAHEIVNGRLHISLTRVSDRKNILVSDFRDKADLIDALICSGFVPLYMGVMPPKFRGIRCVDGALSSNIPILNESTITVSPFAGESDICPDDNSCNLHHLTLSGTSFQMTSNNLYRVSVALFPPSPEILSNMCRQGFDDALRYLKNNKLISCDKHLSIQSALLSVSPAKQQLSTNDVFDESDEEMVTDEVAEGNDEDIDELRASDEESDIISECFDCDERERFALVDSPPVLVQTALQAVCDEVNRGFLSYVYKTKAYQAVSLLAVPYLLPFEVTYALVKKFYDWGPYLSEDMRWFMEGLNLLAQDILASLKSDSTVSSALADRGELLRQWGFRWEMRCGVHMESSSSSALETTFTGQRRKNSHGAKRSSTAAVSASSLNVNMDMSLDVTAANQPAAVKSPLRYVSEIRRQVTEQHRKNSKNLSSHCASLTSKGHRCAGDMSGDSFENCLEVAEQMDSLLAYYYADESSKAIKVVEIFPVAHHTPPASYSTNENVPGLTGARHQVPWNVDQ